MCIRDRYYDGDSGRDGDDVDDECVNENEIGEEVGEEVCEGAGDEASEEVGEELGEDCLLYTSRCV